MKSIIHFTSEFETLKTIIKSLSLRVFYCKEDFYLGENKVSSAVHPMISFSEHVVKAINNKNITYGKFGIAFTNSWINKNKIHQVLYIEKNSLVAKSLAELLKARRKNAKEQLSPKVRLSIMTIKCFTKNSRGYNSYFGINDYDFKSENEWRYVPTKRQIDGKPISLSKSNYLADPDFYNDALKSYPLKFSANDIEYIFVSTEKQKNIIERLIKVDKERIKISEWSTQQKRQKC